MQKQIIYSRETGDVLGVLDTDQWVAMNPDGTVAAETPRGIATVEYNGETNVKTNPAVLASVQSALYALLEAAANAYGERNFPRNERERCNAWLADPDISTLKREMITAMTAWGDSMWTSYYTACDAVASGNLAAQFTFNTPRPYTFREIMMA